MKHVIFYFSLLGFVFNGLGFLAGTGCALQAQETRVEGLEPESPLDDLGSLGHLKGRQGAILLFSKSRSNARFDQQLDLLRDYRFELKQRHIIVLQMAGREETRAAIGYMRIDRGMARRLHGDYKPSLKGLDVVLVGQKGKEIKRWNHLVLPQEVLDVYDRHFKQIQMNHKKKVF